MGGARSGFGFQRPGREACPSTSGRPDYAPVLRCGGQNGSRKGDVIDRAEVCPPNPTIIPRIVSTASWGRSGSSRRPQRVHDEHDGAGGPASPVRESPVSSRRTPRTTNITKGLGPVVSLVPFLRVLCDEPARPGRRWMAGGWSWPSGPKGRLNWLGYFNTACAKRRKNNALDGTGGANLH